MTHDSGTEPLRSSGMIDDRRGRPRLNDELNLLKRVQIHRTEQGTSCKGLFIGFTSYSKVAVHSREKGGFKKRQSGQVRLALAVARARALALSVCASAAARWGSGRPYTPDKTSSSIPAIAVAVGAAGLVNEDGGGLLMTKRMVRTLVAIHVETRGVQTIVRG